MAKSKSAELKLPSAHDWRTTDTDEINKRRQRARDEAFDITNTDPRHPIFSNFRVGSRSGLTYSVEIREVRERQFACDCVDFRINGLATCKHIEAVLLQLERRLKRLFQSATRQGSSRIDVVRDTALGTLRLVNANGSLPKAVGEWFNANGVLRNGSLEDAVAAVERLRQADFPQLRVSQEVAPWLEHQRRAEERKQLRRDYELRVQRGEWPAHETKVPLFPYQREGMLHLAFTERALLADEMGLGKTIQAIAACALLHRLGKAQRVLVVTPASLKTEWEEQIQRFTDLPLQLVFGSRHERLKAYDLKSEIRNLKSEIAAPFFTIVNYEQMLADALEVNARLKPDIVVLDEAQRIKNWSTKTTQAIKRLRSRYAFVLTGTPIENRIDELHSLMDFLDPSVLGPLFRFNREFYELDDRGRPASYRNLDKLHERIAPYMLRRRKADVETELPDRTDRNHFVPLSPQQQEEYAGHELVVAQLAHLAKRRPLTQQEQDKLMRHLAMMRSLGRQSQKRYVRSERAMPMSPFIPLLPPQSKTLARVRSTEHPPAMKRNLLFLPLLILASSLPAADKSAPGDQMLADYFRNETAGLAERCLADIKTIEDWKSKREEYRRQLQEMLGLWPMPERTDLKPVITGKTEHEEFAVEKLHFQASPQLYVTANLYLPKQLEKPAPAILYVCGHSRVFTNGISYGNKVGYQHHGAWFARNGYVCLTIDTLQLGEIEGLHHGTHREGMWWWNSRGYTPAGVEAWFGIRALDYLCSRPEVDKERIGMTGRSGGGSYTWTVAALDDRVKVAAPVAGITDMQNQVVDGCVEGHCDCMFFVNTYRWDFPQVAALLAPRPLLIANSDKDSIFPLNGVVRLHERVRDIYRLYGAEKNLGLLITEGPHSDTQDLQVPVFRWFNRFLKGEQPLIEMAARKFFSPEQLRVFDKLPPDAVNTNIHSLFVPKAQPLAADELKSKRESVSAALKEKTFGGWPAEDTPLHAKQVFSVEREGLKFSAWDFTSQPEVRLRLYFIERAAGSSAGGIVKLTVMEENGWRNWLGAVRAGFEDQLAEELNLPNAPEAATQRFADFKNLWVETPGSPASSRSQVTAKFAAQAYFAPRGVGLTAWSGDAKKLTQIRRRFMLLGQTLDGMRVWDIRRAVQMIHFVREADSAKVNLAAARPMAVNTGVASLFEPGARLLMTKDLLVPEEAQPDYLNVLKEVDFPQVLEMAGADRERTR